ncbi:MAG TPA: MFS transporter [Burkholderiales bacterium]|nr:MFS transporter [Burkholderiales bacterium]
MNRAVFLLSLAAFASAASLRATDPLLPLIAGEHGVTTGAASAVVTAFALSYGLLQVVCGPLGDRYGRYPTITAAAFVSAFGSAACALAPSLDLLVAARFVSGATMGAFIPLALAWIGDTVAYERRQPLLARFLVGQMAGVAFGTAAAGWLGEHFGWRAIFLALAALLLLIAVLLLTEIRVNPLAGRGGAGKGSIRESVKRMPGMLAHRRLRILFAAGFTEGLFIFGALAFVAVHFQSRFALGPGAAGTLMAMYAAGGVVYALLARRAVRRLGERGLVTLGGIALFLGYATLAFAPSVLLATLGITVVGAGFYMLHTTVQMHVTQVAPEERGSAVALFATFLFLGQASGVWLAARVVDAAGVAPVFACAALGLGVLAVLFRYFLSGGGGT